jgi:hypothetical protein
MDAPLGTASDVPKWKRYVRPLKPAGASTMNITTVGVDLAKNLFQVHGVDERGKAVLRKALKRTEVVSFFDEVAAVSHRDGGLRKRTFLGAQAH